MKSNKNKNDNLTKDINISSGYDENGYDENGNQYGIPTLQDIQEKFPERTYDLESEFLILTAMLKNRDAINIVLQEQVVADTFYSCGHKAIFKAIVARIKQGKPINATKIIKQIQENGDENLIKASYVIDMEQSNITTTIEDLKNLSNRLIQLRGLQKTVSICRKIIGAAEKDTCDAPEIFKAYEPEILQLIGSMSIQNATVKEDTIKELENDFEMRGKGKQKIRTGFQQLDTLTDGGLETSTLTFIGARPGHGKTTLALNIAENMAIQEKVRVIFFSLEMPRARLLRRLTASYNRKRYKDIMDDSITTAEERNEMLMATKILLKRIDIYDKRYNINTVSDMRGIIKTEKEKNGGKPIVVIIDHLLKMKSTVENFRERFTEITRELQTMAVELDIVFIVLSQQNRNIENRTNKNPTTSDLKETGSIEEDADLVIQIYNPGNQPPDPKDPLYRKANIYITKNRDGEERDFCLKYSGALAHYEEYDGHVEPLPIQMTIENENIENENKDPF